jgi:hypothetical protein
MASLADHFYDRVRHPSAEAVGAGQVEGFEHLRGHR